MKSIPTAPKRATPADVFRMYRAIWGDKIPQEKNMPPKRPTELVNASIAVSEAWDKYDAFVEAGDKDGAKACWVALGILEEVYNSRYQQWQILGGTSNIDSLAYPAPLVDFDTAHDIDTKATQEDARF